MQVVMLHKKSLKKLARFGYYDEFGAPGPWARRRNFVHYAQKPGTLFIAEAQGRRENNSKMYGCSGSHPLSPSHFDLRASPLGLEKSPSRASSATTLQAILIKVGYFGRHPYP